MRVRDEGKGGRTLRGSIYMRRRGDKNETASDSHLGFVLSLSRGTRDGEPYLIPVPKVVGGVKEIQEDRKWEV